MSGRKVGCTVRNLRFALLLALVLVLGVGCGDDPETVGGPAGTVNPDDLCQQVVDADQVVVEGDLSAEQADMVEWALSRFASAGLQLPERLEIGFDPTRVSCAGALGHCDPDSGREVPAVWVCEAEGRTAFRVLDRRITLLHELAHVWHWSTGDDATWCDLSGIVGGTPCGEDTGDVAWSDRTEERVAIAISWGLLDQSRRPVASPLGCSLLYEQFHGLTGVEPLGPIEPVCLPDAPA
jgi:hypothetical protein